MKIKCQDLIEIKVLEHEASGDEYDQENGGRLKLNIKNITNSDISLELQSGVWDASYVTWNVTLNGYRGDTEIIRCDFGQYSDSNIFVSRLGSQKDIDVEVSSSYYDCGIVFKIFYRNQQIANVSNYSGLINYYEIEDKAAGIGQVTDMLKYVMNASKLPSTGSSAQVDLATDADAWKIMSDLFWGTEWDK